MLIKDLEDEQFEYEEVFIEYDIVSEEWKIKKDGWEVVKDGFLTHREALVWATKVSKIVIYDRDEYVKELQDLWSILKKLRMESYGH